MSSVCQPNWPDQLSTVFVVRALFGSTQAVVVERRGPVTTICAVELLNPVPLRPILPEHHHRIDSCGAPHRQQAACAYGGHLRDFGAKDCPGRRTRDDSQGLLVLL